jgi:hypothetical protein
MLAFLANAIDANDQMPLAEDTVGLFTTPIMEPFWRVIAQSS